MIDYWPLLGILLVVVGFALRLNPLLVVTVAAIVTGLLGGHGPSSRSSRPSARRSTTTAIIAIVWIVLPVIGLLERYGLQQRARDADPRHAGRDGRAPADRLSRAFAR